MFRPADHSRRTPPWLQSYTKENYIAQIMAAVLFIAGVSLRDWYEERKLKQERKVL